MRIYTTRTSAEKHEIIDALGEHWKDFDIEAISDELITYNGKGFVMSSENYERFAEVVQQHDLTCKHYTN